jgi:hypothetical protein
MCPLPISQPPPMNDSSFKVSTSLSESGWSITSEQSALGISPVRAIHADRGALLGTSVFAPSEFGANPSETGIPTLASDSQRYVNPTHLL